MLTGNVDVLQKCPTCSADIHSDYRVCPRCAAFVLDVRDFPEFSQQIEEVRGGFMGRKVVERLVRRRWTRDFEQVIFSDGSFRFDLHAPTGVVSLPLPLVDPVRKNPDSKRGWKIDSQKRLLIITGGNGSRLLISAEKGMSWIVFGGKLVVTLSLQELRELNSKGLKVHPGSLLNEIVIVEKFLRLSQVEVERWFEGLPEYVEQ